MPGDNFCISSYVTILFYTPSVNKHLLPPSLSDIVGIQGKTCFYCHNHFIYNFLSLNYSDIRMEWFLSCSSYIYFHVLAQFLYVTSVLLIFVLLPHSLDKQPPLIKCPPSNKHPSLSPKFNHLNKCLVLL